MMDEEYGLTNDKMDNVNSVANKIKEIDLEKCNKLKKDDEEVTEEIQVCLCILQSLVLWPVFKMYLFTRKYLLIFAKMVLSGRLVTNLDSTGQLLQRPAPKPDAVSFSC